MTTKIVKEPLFYSKTTSLMKITAAFYFNSKDLGREWSLDVESQAFSGTDGNLIQIYLELKKREMPVCLLCTKLPRFKDVNSFEEKDIITSYQFCLKNKIDFLIYNVKRDKLQLKLHSYAKTVLGNTKLIAWAQNTPEFNWLTSAYRCSSFYRLIAVSNVQRYQLAHHPIFTKTIVIFNFVSNNILNQSLGNNSCLTSKVLYVGALKESKGFQHLSRAWPQIKKNFPSATLEVCGSPGLYNENSKLGKEGIAEKEFEKEILDSLGGSRNSALELGVTFLGSVPKNDLYSKISSSCVVVVNPNTSGSIETFCVSAAEAMALQKPVVGGAAGGLLEIIGHRIGGLLASTATELTKNILNILHDPSMAENLGKKGRARALKFFTIENAVERWHKLINNEFITPEIDSSVSVKFIEYYLKVILRHCIPISAIASIKIIKNNIFKQI